MAAVNALMIAVVRVYFGVRHSHDMVAGLLFGVLAAWTGLRVGVRLEVGRPWHTEDRSS